MVLSESRKSLNYQKQTFLGALVRVREDVGRKEFPIYLFKNPGNVKLYGLDEIEKEKYQRLALRNQYTKAAFLQEWNWETGPTA